MDKETYIAYCGFNWDRAGKLWKIWQSVFVGWPIPGDEPMTLLAGSWGVDLQFGLVNKLQFIPFRINKANVGGLSVEDINPASMVKRAR